MLGPCNSDSDMRVAESHTSISWTQSVTGFLGCLPGRVCVALVGNPTKSVYTTLLT